MLVSDVMATAVEFASPDESVQAAAVLMGELDVGALPVGSPDDLQGVLTDRDVLFRVVAEGRDNTQVRVREVMTRRVFTCPADATLTAAMDLMADYHVRRLAVTDGSGRVAGWITLSDISRRLLLDSGVVRDGLRQLSER